MTHELYRLVSRLEEARIHFVLWKVRLDAITVLVTVPGQRWEIDVFQGGKVEVEKFMSEGVRDAGATLEQLIADFGERSNMAHQGFRWVEPEPVGRDRA